MLNLVKNESSVTWVTVAWVTVEGRIVENPPNGVGGVFVGRGSLSLYFYLLKNIIIKNK